MNLLNDIGISVVYFMWKDFVHHFGRWKTCNKLCHPVFQKCQVKLVRTFFCIFLQKQLLLIKCKKYVWSNNFVALFPMKIYDQKSSWVNAIFVNPKISRDRTQYQTSDHQAIHKKLLIPEIWYLSIQAPIAMLHIHFTIITTPPTKPIVFHSKTTKHGYY